MTAIWQTEIDVSVVTHNSSKWIERFVHSLLAQSFPTQCINLILRDHESSDSTVELCHEAAARHQGSFRSFRVVQGPNHGFGFGHNRNREAGSAALFLVTNVDLEFEPDAIEQVVRASLNDDERTAAWELRQKPYEHPKYYDPVTLATSWASSACVLFRRACLDAVGGYDERIFLYGEDVELSYRLRDRGYLLRYCPRAVCWHYSYQDPHQVKPQQFFGGTLANWYLRLRYGTPLQILAGAARQVSLWFWHPPVKGLWSGLARNAAAGLYNAPYFLASRKRSVSRFAFHGWDYAPSREGAALDAPRLEGNAPLVSIVMRTYRGRLGWLRQAVASVLNQTYPNVELVVVEDGSDEARDFVSEVAGSGRLASVVYEPVPKQGRCHAGNAGLARASGRLLTFLDDDDLFFADHLETLCGTLLGRPDLAAVYGLAFQVQTTVGAQDPLVLEEQHPEVIFRQRFSRAILWHHNYIPIQAVVFRRELYDALGGFDESLENLEDWNLWTRYSLGQDFMLVEKATSLYRVPGSTSTLVGRQKQLDDYYAKAVAKQRDMKITLSPAEVVEMSVQIARNINAVIIPYVKVRNTLIRNRLLNAFYYLAVRLVNRRRR